jgi:hypothetical protein
MTRATVTQPRLIGPILMLQPIPLLLFPPESFRPSSQEWWLPALLAVMVVLADVQLLVRRSPHVWPWDLLGFAHGFNIISRLMMLWPHATKVVGGATVMDASYVGLTVVAMTCSGGLLWYLELPEVRMGLLRE